MTRGIHRHEFQELNTGWLTSIIFIEVAELPQHVFCERCNAILYDGAELELPSEIIRRYNGICPKCRKRLSYQPERIKILVNNEGPLIEVT